ncbi:hypothetical protein PFISCL1PPCAC_12249, partial [Pristionchus fissidentatus]
LFFGDFQNASKKEFVIAGVKHEKFTLVLKMLYVDDEINGSNVEAILKVAGMFGFKILLNKTNEFLLNSSSLSDHTKLRLSDHYK